MRIDQFELLRLIGDFRSGEVVIAGKIDRTGRLPLLKAGRLIASSIRAKGLRLSISGIVDLTVFLPKKAG